MDSPKSDKGSFRYYSKTVTCPHCHETQKESRQVISTYCRSCGRYFRPGQKVESTKLGARRSFFLWRQKPIPKHRINCFVCGNDHEVSKYAEATVCTSCGTRIELRDVRIDSPASRMVDTRGVLHITKKGVLTNASTICGKGRIEGSWVGRIYCDGEAKISSRGNIQGELIAQKVVIERRADVSLPFPVHVAEIEVRGKIHASVFCSGSVYIRKHGLLEGDIHARSIIVDKGGTYSGSLQIQAQDAPVPPQDHPYVRKQALPLKIRRTKRKETNDKD